MSVVNFMGLVSLVPPCHPAFVGISWVQKFFSWVFHGSKIFSRGYFVGPKFFSRGYFVGPKFSRGYSWVWNFSCGYFVGQIFFLVNILWVQFFPYHWFRDSKILSCWLWQKQKYQNTSQTTDSFLNRFQQL